MVSAHSRRVHMLMKDRKRSAAILTLLVLGLSGLTAQSDDPLARGFRNPPPEARLRCYWWWLNGNVTQASITRDLTGMAKNGFGGVMIIDAGGADQQHNRPVPAGPMM